MGATKNLGEGKWQFIDARQRKWVLEKRKFGAGWDAETTDDKSLHAHGDNRLQLTQKLIDQFGVYKATKDKKERTPRKPNNVFITATGHVLGTLWDNSDGAYGSRPIYGKTLEDITKQAEKGIEDKSLDGGMGFQSLKGAFLTLKIETTKIINGKKFVNTEREGLFVGDLSIKEKEFLLTL